MLTTLGYLLTTVTQVISFRPSHNMNTRCSSLRRSNGKMFADTRDREHLKMMITYECKIHLKKMNIHLITGQNQKCRLTYFLCGPVAAQKQHGVDERLTDSFYCDRPHAQQLETYTENINTHSRLSTKTNGTGSLIIKKGKGSFYIAQYPVRWTAQSASHFLP